MSESFQIDIFQLRGSAREIGFRTAQKLKDNKFLNIYKQKMKPEIDIDNMEAIFSNFAPHLIEELKGIADGLSIPYKKAAAMLSGFDAPKVDAMGCSAVVTDAYYVRNYDFSPQLYAHSFNLIDPENGYASAGFDQQILGRLDGVNSEGLVIGLHFVSFNVFQVGVSAWTAIRMVLDTCASTDEAVHMLKEIPHAACYNFSIGDKAGKIAVVEANPEQVTVRNDDSYLSCVNHFSKSKVTKYEP